MKDYPREWILVGIFALSLFSLLGLLIVLGLVTPQMVKAVLSSFKNPLVQWVMVGVLGFFFVLGVWLIYVLEEKERTLTLRNPLGEIEISLHALSDFLRRVGEEMEGVEKMRAKIFPREEGVEVFLTLWVQAQEGIPRLLDELQNVVRDYLTKTVGVENVGQIRIKIRKIL